MTQQFLYQTFLGFLAVWPFHKDQRMIDMDSRHYPKDIDQNVEEYHNALIRHRSLFLLLLEFFNALIEQNNLVFDVENIIRIWIMNQNLV